MQVAQIRPQEGLVEKMKINAPGAVRGDCETSAIHQDTVACENPLRHFGRGEGAANSRIRKRRSSPTSSTETSKHYGPPLTEPGDSGEQQSHERIFHGHLDRRLQKNGLPHGIPVTVPLFLCSLLAPAPR